VENIGVLISRRLLAKTLVVLFWTKKTIINNSAQKYRNVALASEKFPLPQIVVYRQLINFSSKSWREQVNFQ
jgi:hypothetical protein